VKVKVTVIGPSGLPAGEREIEARANTLADLRQTLAEMHPGAFPPERVLLAFVNGKSSGSDWNAVTLSEGDAVMLVVPMGGG